SDFNGRSRPPYCARPLMVLSLSTLTNPPPGQTGRLPTLADRDRPPPALPARAPRRYSPHPLDAPPAPVNRGLQGSHPTQLLARVLPRQPQARSRLDQGRGTPASPARGRRRWVPYDHPFSPV